MQLEDALDRFLVQLRADGRSVHTIGQYRRHVRLLASWARTEGVPCEIADIGHEDLAAFLTSPVARLRPDGVEKKATSMNRLRSSLRCFFGYLHEASYIPSNPARLVRLARCGSPPPRSLGENEQRRLVEYLATADGRTARRDEAMYRIMLDAGTRVGPTIALNVDDVDLARGEIRLRRDKNDREEVVFVPQRLSGILSLYIGGREAGPLFTGPAGRRLSQRHVQRRFGEVLAKAGITRRLGCHSLRHTFGQRLFDRTHDLLLVKGAMNHRAISSTLAYVRLDRERLRAVIG